MKSVLVAVLVLFSVSAVHADPENDAAVRACLERWGKHPFDAKKLEYRSIAAKVKVMGVGDNVHDTKATDKPELVLVKPAVAVMSKTVLELKNPNGWYCLKGRTSVMGKIEIQLHCKANLAASSEGVAVLGANDTGGTSVLGSARVIRACN